MPLFSSRSSWTNQARAPRCPKVDDCEVKQTLMASAREQRLWGVKTKKEVAAAKKEAAKVAAQQKKDRKRARGRSGGGNSGGGWPFAGKYDPAKDKKQKGK